MVSQNTTVSVIGLGTDADVDAQLLQDIARRGGGRMFFNEDASALPALFAQETVAVARSTFVDKPVGVEPTSGWLEVSSKVIENLPMLDGYNLSYLRDDATAAAYTRDDYEAPLVAFWNRGGGRVAAVSFPLGGEYSARVRRWPEFGDFTQTLARWLMGDDVVPHQYRSAFEIRDLRALLAAVTGGGHLRSRSGKGKLRRLCEALRYVQLRLASSRMSAPVECWGRWGLQNTTHKSWTSAPGSQ